MLIVLTDQGQGPQEQDDNVTTERFQAQVGAAISGTSETGPATCHHPL
jgi:hypothetical protein